MMIRLLLVTIPLSTFLLQTNLVLQLLYFFGVPVGRKNRQKDDQHAVMTGEEVKVPLIYGPGKSKYRESSKCLDMLNSSISSELTYCYESPFFYPQDEGKRVCSIEFNRTINFQKGKLHGNLKRLGYFKGTIQIMELTVKYRNS